MMMACRVVVGVEVLPQPAASIWTSSAAVQATVLVTTISEKTDCVDC